MRIEFQPGDYREVVCDLLAYPVFEDEAKDFSSLESLDTDHARSRQIRPFFPRIQAGTPSNLQNLQTRRFESAQPAPGRGRQKIEV